MRKIIRHLKNDSKISLKDLGLQNMIVIKVYTILNENAIFQRFNPKTGTPYTVTDLEDANLVHLRNVFFEDKLHDWDVLDDFFYLHTHSVENDELIDILVETREKEVDYER